MGFRNYDITSRSRRYKGFDFKSTLEVKWAIFFDCMQWEWLYESKTFTIAKNTYYTPDFYFPIADCYAEVKPNELLDFERKKCIDLIITYPGTKILLLIGDPHDNPLPMLINGGCGWYVIPVKPESKFFPFYYSDVYSPLFFIDNVLAAFKANLKYYLP